LADNSKPQIPTGNNKSDSLLFAKGPRRGRIKRLKILPFSNNQLDKLSNYTLQSFPGWGVNPVYQGFSYAPLE
jgi:hypothetical protein